MGNMDTNEQSTTSGATPHETGPVTPGDLWRLASAAYVRGVAAGAREVTLQNKAEVQDIGAQLRPLLAPVTARLFWMRAERIEDAVSQDVLVSELTRERDALALAVQRGWSFVYDGDRQCYRVLESFSTGISAEQVEIASGPTIFDAALAACGMEG